MARTDGHFVWRHIAQAQCLKGEDQIPRHVASLSLKECADILAASPIGLPSLAALRDECRVEASETRSFEEVLRTWTVEVLSSLEGG